MVKSNIKKIKGYMFAIGEADAKLHDNIVHNKDAIVQELVSDRECLERLYEDFRGMRAMSVMTYERLDGVFKEALDATRGEVLINHAYDGKREYEQADAEDIEAAVIGGDMAI